MVSRSSTGTGKGTAKCAFDEQNNENFSYSREMGVPFAASLLTGSNGKNQMGSTLKSTESALNQQGLLHLPLAVVAAPFSEISQTLNLLWSHTESNSSPIQSDKGLFPSDHLNPLKVASAVGSFATEQLQHRASDTFSQFGPLYYVKKDGKCIRVMVDFSTGLNHSIIPIMHPLPRPSGIYQHAKHASHVSEPTSLLSLM